MMLVRLPCATWQYSPFGVLQMSACSATKIKGKKSVLLCCHATQSWVGTVEVANGKGYRKSDSAHAMLGIFKGYLGSTQGFKFLESTCMDG